MSAKRSTGKKVALVTGAGSGIGRAIALRLVADGHKVVVSDIDAASGAETVRLLRKGAALFVKSDTSKPEECEALVARILRDFGALHLAVNNAGISGPAVPVGEYPIEAWNKVLAVNLSGVFYGMRYQLPAMLKTGGGAIVNIASVLGQVGFRGASAYAAAKHGVIGLTQTAALEYGARQIRVNAVGPGFVQTPLLGASLPAFAVKALEGMHAMRRLGEPQEVAELVAWLCSDQASFVTGAYYAVDGGYLAQ